MDSTLIIVLGIILLALIILNNITVVPSPSPSPPVGGCAGTQYGCCPDGITAKMNAYGTNCLPAPYPPPPPPPPPEPNP